MPLNPFSIGILSYNHPELTRKCVQSVLDFKDDPNFPGEQNIILCHNGSAPKNVQQLKDLFPKIQHLVLDQNRHFSGGCNELLNNGFKNSEWVLFLTNDCELLNLTPPPVHPAMIAPCILRRNHKVDSMGGEFTPAKLKLTHLKKPPTEASWTFHPSQKSFFYIPATAFYLHRSVFQKVGPFDENLGTYFEDVDFSMRCQFQGFNLEYQPDLKIQHGIGKTCHKLSQYTIYYFPRNRKKISWKYISGPFQSLQYFMYFLVQSTRLLFQLLKQKRYSDLSLWFKSIVD